MENKEDNQVVNLRVDDIMPNRFQPREVFDETGLEELADSIREHGVIQPIIVRKVGDKYELIAGERRTKASAMAGKTTIPAIVRDMDDKESAKVSLLENLQRKNLSPIEEARTFKRILEMDNMTQGDLARTMGKSQPMIANKLRLLSLPEEVQDALMKNQISERHARSLLNVKDKKEQLNLLNRIRDERLTVRQLDNLIKELKNENIPSNLNENNSDSDNFSSDNLERDDKMNNSRNYGNMGLNDYQSSVNNNVYNGGPNNIPNPFNQSGNGFNNNTNTNNYQSLGSMLDGATSQDVNFMQNTNNDSNIFVSHIREDEVKSNDNQFLPNFNSINNNSFQNDMSNNFNNYGNNMMNQNNNFDQPNYNDNFNNNFNDYSNNMMNQNNNFDQPNYNDNFSNNFNNYGNNMMNQGNNYNQPNYNDNINNNFNDYGNNMMNQSNNFSHPNYNDNINNKFNDYGNNMMNQSNNYNQQNYSDNINNNFNDYGNNMMNQNNNYNSNYNSDRDGNLFNQPLNLVGVDNSVPNDNYVNPFNEPYDNNLFDQQMSIDDNVNDDTNTSNNQDIEIIDEGDSDNIISDSAANVNQDEYIKLDPEQTIYDTRGAVLELKKTTDVIKQNHIPIETEEIDYDDYYQITIKIKKEQL